MWALLWCGKLHGGIGGAWLCTPWIYLNKSCIATWQLEQVSVSEEHRFSIPSVMSLSDLIDTFTFMPLIQLEIFALLVASSSPPYLKKIFVSKVFLPKMPLSCVDRKLTFTLGKSIFILSYNHTNIYPHLWKLFI